jgi:hypothetical protein
MRRTSTISFPDASNLQRPPVLDWITIAAILVFGFAMSPAQADADASRQAPRSPPKYYQQPSGFADHKWGDPFATFKGLGTAITVEASWDDGKRLDDHFQCVRTADGTCDMNAIVRWANTQGQRSVLTLVSQHRIEAQGFRLSGVTMYPVTHFFCGQWRELLKKAPPGLEKRMGYCGMRLEFESENQQALADLPADHVTQYQELLRHLILTYGKPYGYRGNVSVSDAQDSTRSARREFPARYRWCTSLDSIFAPKCDVKMTLAFDAESGKGSLLIAAAALVQFATAQRSEDGRTHGALFYELVKDP